MIDWMVRPFDTSNSQWFRAGEWFRFAGVSLVDQDVGVAAFADGFSDGDGFADVMEEIVCRAERALEEDLAGSDVDVRRCMKWMEDR